MSVVPSADLDRSTGGDPAEPTGAVAIVVVNYASHQLLRDNLAATPLPVGVRVVVVDNLSTAGERRAVEQLCDEHGWELVARPDNAGFGPAVNAGVERAARSGAEGVILLNPDARASSEVLAELRRSVLLRPEVAVSPRVVTAGGRVEYRGAQVHLRTGRIRSISPTFGDDGRPHRVDGQVPGALPGPVQGWLTGACLAVGLGLLRRAGGLSEDYFLYWEDVDLSARLERADGQLLVRHDLSVTHDEGGTQPAAAGQSRADSYYYWNCRNRLTFAAHNLSRRRALAWLLRTPVVSAQIVVRSERSNLRHTIRPLLAAARGSLAGGALVLRSLAARRATLPTHRPVLVVHPGAELYGSDRMLLETVEGLLQHRHPVTVVLPGDGPLVTELRRRGAEVRFCRMPVLRKSALRPAGLIRLLADAVTGLWPAVRLVSTAGRGGVYVSTLTIPSWTILSRLLRRRVTCHVHEAERSASPLLRRLLALPVRCADEVLVNSEFSLAVLAEAAPGLRARARVVYNGVPGPDEVQRARDSITSAVRLVYVGRLSPRKGPDVAIDAVRVLIDAGRDVQLDVLGDVFTGYEWFAEQLRAAAANLSERVTFVGFDRDIWPRLAAADIVLVPSTVDEPFGNTAVEAVLAARPAVVSATSGLREAAAGFDSVLMVAPGDPVALADAVGVIMDSWPDFVQRAVSSAALAGERYSPQRYRDEVAAVVLGEPVG